jgi:hypothetical protein
MKIELFVYKKGAGGTDWIREADFAGGLNYSHERKILERDT